MNVFSATQTIRPLCQAEGVSGLVNGGGWICTLSYWNRSRETELEICQPAELPFFLISLGEIIQQSLTRVFLQINNAINWIYSKHLTPDVLCIRFPPLWWNILAFECLTGVMLALRRWMTHKSHICFWFEAMTMWISITSISYNRAKLMEEISLEDIYKTMRMCARSTFSSHNYSLINH